MKLEPLSHCPDRTDAAVLRVRFDTRSRVQPAVGSAGRIGPSAVPAPTLFTRMRLAIGRLFRRSAPDHACACDVDARLLELETHKLSTQHLGRLRD
jgi:hypothetical protein